MLRNVNDERLLSFTSGIVPTFYLDNKGIYKSKTFTQTHVCVFGTEETVKANAETYERIYILLPKKGT